MKKISTKKLVLSAMFMALTMVATMFIRIPLPLGYVNLGDAFALLSVFIVGPLYGTISAGVGSALADLFGYIEYAPGTLIIKTLMVLVSYLTYKALFKLTDKALLSEITAGIAGTIVMASGYFLYECLFFASVGVAIVSMPWNLLQGVVGVTLFIIVMRILSAIKILGKLQNLR